MGAARFYVQLLALQLCPPSFPFYAMVDDTVVMWRVVEQPGELARPTSWWGRSRRTPRRALSSVRAPPRRT